MNTWRKYSRQFHIAAGLITVLILGLADYITGPTTSLSIFYLVPIVQVTWFGGSIAGVVTALCSAAAWLIGELVASQGAGRPGVPLWNVILIFGFFLGISIGLALFRRRLGRVAGAATDDPLTGVANAKRFREAIELEKDRALRYKHPITLAQVEVDDFAQFARQLGARPADDLLRTVAATFRENLRSSDMVARLSNDQFGILLVEAEPEEVQMVVARARQRLMEAMEKKGWPATLSFGVITFCRPASPVAEMLQLVTALSRLVKAEGQGSVKFEVYSD
jgi:diguanylate cyclase (GGDEF)-like protein